MPEALLNALIHKGGSEPLCFAFMRNLNQTYRMNPKPALAGRAPQFAARVWRVLLLTPLFGCGKLDPCPGVALDARFELEVLAPTREWKAGCLEAWGLGSGALVAGRIAELSAEYNCLSGVPEIEAVGDWSWQREPEAGIVGGYTLESLYLVSRADCSARLWLIFSSKPAFGCDASRGDRCELRLGITPVDVALCPPICSGILDVRAERL